jgi:multidrug efflux system outer membrane protein
VTVTAEVGRNYVELRGLQEQLEVATRNAQNQAETLDLTNTLLEEAAARSSTPRRRRPSSSARARRSR